MTRQQKRCSSQYWQRPLHASGSRKPWAMSLALALGSPLGHMDHFRMKCAFRMRSVQTSFQALCAWQWGTQGGLPWSCGVHSTGLFWPSCSWVVVFALLKCEVSTLHHPGGSVALSALAMSASHAVCSDQAQAVYCRGLMRRVDSRRALCLVHI